MNGREPGLTNVMDIAKAIAVLPSNQLRKAFVGPISIYSAVRHHRQPYQNRNVAGVVGHEGLYRIDLTSHQKELKTVKMGVKIRKNSPVQEGANIQRR
jgi:hypothetical protein